MKNGEREAHRQNLALPPVLWHTEARAGARPVHFVGLYNDDTGAPISGTFADAETP